MPIKEETTINHLPNELLYKIFEYLGTTDSNVAATICQKWFVLIDHLNYHKNTTKLVLKEKNLKNELELFINGFKRITTVTLMDDVQLFGQNCDNFWRAMGDTVTEIEFVRCNNLDNDVLCNILRHLRKLKSLKLYAPCFAQWNLFRKDNYLVTRRNRKELEPTLSSITHLTLSDAGINTAHFKNLVGALPNLSSLNTMSLYFQPTHLGVDEERYLSRNCLLNWLQDRAGKVKDLELKHVDNDLLLDITSVKGLKLRRCSLQLEDVEVKTLDLFIKSQPYLQEVVLHLTDDKNGLLEYCQEIRGLKELKLDPCIQTSFEKLSKAQSLQKLTMSCNEQLFKSSKIQQNPRLKELILSQPFTDMADFISITETFPNLTTFSYDGVLLNDAQLHILFRGLPYLRNLRLENCQNITCDGIRSHINQLCGLQYLTLLNCQNVAGAVLHGIQLPELRHIQISELNEVPSLDELCIACPSLEQIKITTKTQSNRLCVDALTQNYSRLKNVDIQQRTVNPWSFTDAMFAFDR